MRLTRLFLPVDLEVGQTISLDDRTRHHCGTVLRAKVGDVVYLFNGNGSDYRAVLSSVSKKQIEADIEAVEPRATESPLQIHLGQCVSSSQRFDIAVQKATEMGVTSITPLLSERSQKVSKQQYEKKCQHWQQIAIHACEQSHRSTMVHINMPQTVDQWLNQQEADKKWVCSISDNSPQQGQEPVNSLAILVGPEGGLTDHEERLANTKGFEALQMGKRILRTETAPIAAISLAQYFWGDY